MRKVKFFSVVFVAICFMAGCASNPMVSVYDNNKEIAGNTNTYNLINVDQTCEDGHLTASVEKRICYLRDFANKFTPVDEYSSEDDVEVNIAEDYVK